MKIYKYLDKDRNILMCANDHIMVCYELYKSTLKFINETKYVCVHPVKVYPVVKIGTKNYAIHYELLNLETDSRYIEDAECDVDKDFDKYTYQLLKNCDGIYCDDNHWVSSYFHYDTDGIFKKASDNPDDAIFFTIVYSGNSAMLISTMNFGDNTEKTITCYCTDLYKHQDVFEHSATMSARVSIGVDYMASRRNYDILYETMDFTMLDDKWDEIEFS